VTRGKDRFFLGYDHQFTADNNSLLMMIMMMMIFVKVLSCQRKIRSEEEEASPDYLIRLFSFEKNGDKYQNKTQFH